MAQLGSEKNPLCIAIVGSGPSGFYAAEALIKSDIDVKVDMLERLPSPYGLVRSGVAPDHPKLKQAILLYDKIAQSPAFNLIANVTVGKDISVDELRGSHHAIIFTCGAESDRRLGIPGEDLAGSYTATEFVAWYNGHPDYRERQFDLSNEVAVIIGQGNVAADVARILSKTADELKHTDISEHALDALAESKIKDIYVIGRRGPAQAKFTPKELREFGELKNCDAVVDPTEMELNEASNKELEEKTNIVSKKIVNLFQEYSSRPISGKLRRCHFQFLRSPVELLGNSKLENVKIEYNQLSGDPFKQSAKGSGKTYELETGILFRSIGYRGIPMKGVPFHDSWGIFPNVDGRITENNEIVPQFYTAGWIKRGPSGIIGTNRACSVATVNSLLADLDALDSAGQKAGVEALYSLLDSRNVRYLNYQEWTKIDAIEVERGQAKGKPREKITYVKEMLELLN
ncbi:MAG: NADP oxidoreductase [Proteobacteria bacterium]|nr:NADP oxidoreductase [Pseudomonadota bacterium]